MARKRGLRSTAARIAAAGRNGDTELAHLSADEIAILDAWQGYSSINPDTGLPEYFSLGKVLKGVAKAAGALVGGALGGPAGAAIGGAATSALLGDSTQKVLTTGLLSGIGAYGAQQFGLGDSLGISALGSGADLLGRTASAAAPAIATAAGSGGSGFGMSSLLPMLGLGAAAVGAAGSAKAPKSPKPPKGEPEPEWKEYEAMDREIVAPAGDPYSYGQFGPEMVYFDEVNPAMVEKRRGGRVGYRRGGRVHMLYGGGVSEGDASRGGDFGQRDRSSGGTGMGGAQIGRGGGGRNVVGGRAVAGSGRDVDNAMGGGRGGTGMGSFGGLPGQPTRDQTMRQDQLGANYNAAMDDYKNVGQGFTDDPLGALGRLFGGMFGIGEIHPGTQPLGSFQDRTTASWGVDPIGGALGLAGMAGVTPFGMAGAWQGLKSLIGYQGPMISFDEYDTTTDWTGTSALDAFRGPSNPASISALDKLAGAASAGSGTDAFGGTTDADRGYHDRDNQNNRGPAPGALRTPRAAAPTPQTPAPQTPPADDDDDTGTTDPATGRVYHPLTDPYTYGLYGPEHTFFTGDLPMRRGGGVKGPGSGQSDDIPAMLSDGEHVIDAETVAMIGDGSNDAGHRRIEQMKRKVRTKKRKAKPSKIPPKTGGLSQYLRSAA